jgi:hypothetical protein
MSKPTDLQVAAIYMQAAANGNPPTQAVADHWERPIRTASYWVKSAKASGVLPEVNVANPKVLAIAQALNINPDKLEAAILEHAGGDIRITK